MRHHPLLGEISYDTKYLTDLNQIWVPNIFYYVLFVKIEYAGIGLRSRPFHTEYQFEPQLILLLSFILLLYYFRMYKHET